MKKSQALPKNKNNNNYSPHLPKEEIDKIVRKLSDTKLSPTPHLSSHDKNLVKEVSSIVNELFKVIEKEKTFAFQKGLEEGKKYAKR